MINFFKRNKSSINSIVIPDLGWEEVAKTKNIIQWINPEKTISISLNYFDKAPDLPSLKDIKVIRSFYRGQIIEQNGGLIQVDFSESEKQYSVIKTIFKIPQQPSGIVYLASLTLPFKDCSYVIKIQAPEIEMIGSRDSIIADKLMQEGKINNNEYSYENLTSDPYLKSFKKGTLMTKSEESIYDSDFENHPLTLARKLMTEIEQRIELKSEIKKLRRFVG